ncbi:GNAT family N-acetyltransferase [Rhodovastum atsumiense]|uniref:GNAT family N-acetyltransferase n=1 Tax=Rhodovastum atsumiense TaxID=504468 RepID=UPI00139F2A9D|nr:GNAT family N-acetyltransferase [Rhodovastum atsumiense]CAH2600439.1 GNAT family N-acetyltransferase [Rhodovastum atsumiense]
MILRPASPADASQVAEVDLAARSAALPDVDCVHSPEEIRQWIAESLIPSGGVFVAEQGGRIVGYIAVRDSWVDQLHVRPTHWRHGVGTLLLRLVQERHPHGLTCYCFRCNSRARMFYEHHGFTAIGLSDEEADAQEQPDILYSWPGITKAPVAAAAAEG